MDEYTELILYLRKIGRKIIQFGNPIYKDRTAQRILDAADAIEKLATNYDAATDIMKHQTEYIEELSKRVQELEYDPTCDPEWRDSPKGRQEDTLDW